MTCAADKPAPPPIPGYRFADVIGEGSVGTVWRAAMADGRQVAVKVMPVTPFNERDFLKAISGGEQTVYRVAPRAKIVPIIEIGETEDTVWLTMAYFAHGTLERLHGRTTADASRWLAAAHSLAMSLGEVHDAGYFHGDLKPSNILLDEHGEPYLIDFYFAASRRRNRESGFSVPLGTPRYMSPEQASGQPMTAQCDIYSFGVLVYELMTGRLPYPETPRNIREMVKVILAGKIVPPREANAELPSRLAALLTRLLALKPENRPGTMWEVADELARITGGDHGPAGGKPPWWRRWLGLGNTCAVNANGR